MTSIFSDGALHPGRDANDAWWIVVRRADDWGADPRPGDHGTRFDATRNVLELQPVALGPVHLPPPSVVAEDGTRYVLDAAAAQILRIPPCETAPVPLAGVGGPGWQTGRFAGLAAIAIDERGWLYVAERDNHRVQVIDPGQPGGPAARVVIALGATDAWGRPVAGTGAGPGPGLSAPSAIAVGPSRIYVASDGGWIQTFDRAFRAGGRFFAGRPGDSSADVIALAALGDDLIVALAGWSRLLRFGCDGRLLGELPAGDAPGLGDAVAAAMAQARFALEGTRVVGPIDGGRDGSAWHQVIVDAVLPPGTRIEVQTWAADAIAAPPPALATVPVLPELGAAPEPTPWAPAAPLALPATGEADRGELARPVLSDVSAWTRWRSAPYRRGARWSLAGDGPNASAGMVLPEALARRLRAGDAVALSRRGLPTVTTTIAAIAPRAVTVIASGDRAPVYGAGTQVVLRERDGRAVEGAVVITLGAGEVIDLTSIAADDGLADLTWPHRLLAMLRRGDVLELRLAARRVQLEIEAIDAAPAAVMLAAAAAGDYRDAVLELVAPVDRMVCEHAEGWGDGLPPGSTLDVTVHAGGVESHESRVVAWSDPEVATVWTQSAPPASWVTLAPAAAPVATDRGRYLWVKLRLRGARRHPADVLATATPEVRALRVVGPRLSYLSYLPAVYGLRDADTPPGAVFLERFLALFEGRLTAIEGRYELVARLLNPYAADDDWLAFVASWFDLVLDPAWPRARRAGLLSQIFSLYKLRGTREGLIRFVEAFTGHRPELIEGFQIRPRAGLVLGCAGVLGCAPLGGLDTEDAAAEELLAAYAHRVTVVAYVDDDCELEAAGPALAALIDAIKPAHVDVDLRIAAPDSRIGLASTIGLDFVLGDDRARPAPLGTAGALGQPAPVLGVDTLLHSSDSGAALAEAGAPPVGGFTIS